ncbi:MAG TPA: hypothetical protein VLJ68_07230 [Chitinophagaceae bacterium]|nr:hypothetical protein [Chitinophagaceae bacterium]
MPKVTLLLLPVCLLFGLLLNGQDTLKEKKSQFPAAVIEKIDKKIAALNKEVDKKSNKLLTSLQKLESSIRRELSEIDSNAANLLFDGAETRYNRLKDDPDRKINTPVKHAGEYLPYLDSLSGGLSFLKNDFAASPQNILPPGLTGSLEEIRKFESKLLAADNIKQFIKLRKQQISQFLVKYTSLPRNIARKMTDFNKRIYYYSAQIREYKEMFRDPDKLTKKALSLLNKLPAFQQFMKQHSQLAGLLNLPGATTSAGTGFGLQTRATVTSFLQNQMGTGGPNAASLISTSFQTAQGQIDVIRNRLNSMLGRAGDLDMPDFKPNNQKVKSFFKRLEFGSNFQSAHSSSFFPITTDLGLSLGYKLSDKNTIGLGLSYKIGWGKDIKHIDVTSQGMGFRSFLDVHLKKSLYISGGFEYNYQKPFRPFSITYNLNEWQKSGLMGLSKIVQVKSKLFKKARVQLLWDFLSYRQLPRTQAFKFRIGYNF